MNARFIAISLLTGAITLSVTGQNAPVIEWQRSYGGSSHEDSPSIQRTGDGGYIIASTTWSFDGDVTGNHGAPDCWLLRLDTDGNIIWRHSYGAGGDERCGCVRETLDDGFIVVGSTSSSDGVIPGYHGALDGWVFKVNSEGDLQWQKAIGGSQSEDFNSIEQTTDGGYILAGSTSSNNGDVSGLHGPGSDFWIVKLSPTGSIQWQRCFGGTGNEWGSAAHQTSDGGYVASGTTNSFDGDVTGNNGVLDGWVIRLDAFGNVLWQSLFGGNSLDSISWIREMALGGFMFCGTTRSTDGQFSGNNGMEDAWLVKLDETGNTIWQQLLGGTSYDVFGFVLESMDGTLLAIGTTHSNDGDVSGYHGGYADGWLVKLNGDGGILWQRPLGGSADDRATELVETSDGEITVVGLVRSMDGDVTFNHGSNDTWVAKFSSEVGIDEHTFEVISITSNPVRDYVHIKLNEPVNGQVYLVDVQGRVVHTEPFSGVQKVLDLSGIDQGAYILRIISGIQEFAQKLILE